MAETLGSLCDKLTIVKLKEYHTEDETRLQSLKQQAQQLQAEIGVFVADAVAGIITPEQLTFSANKVYKKEGNETRDISGKIGEVFAELAKVNCDLWHEQEKVYEFENVPAEKKDSVVKRLAILNLERNKCIDAIDRQFQSAIAGKKINMPKAIIFGMNGQDGFYLSQLLQQNQIEVTAVSRSAGAWVQGDVGNRSFVEALIKSKQPDYIFHLAANSKVHHELLFEHQSTIVNGTLNILESVFQYSPLSRIFIAGSGLQFVNDGNPVNEKNEFIARDAYSLARVQSVYAARYYRSKGIKSYTGYLFHHDSPLRTQQHLNRKIADAVKAIAAGKEYSLTIGDISVEKEFGFAGDIAAGIFHLLQQDMLFEACIGTGKAYSIKKWLELCFNSIGKDWKNYVQLNNEYVADFRKLVSDPSAINATGWKAETNIEELAKLMLTPSS